MLVGASVVVVLHTFVNIREYILVRELHSGQRITFYIFVKNRQQKRTHSGEITRVLTMNKRFEKSNINKYLSIKNIFQLARRQNSGNPFHSSILEEKDNITKYYNSQNLREYISKKTVTEYRRLNRIYIRCGWTSFLCSQRVLLP